MVKDFKYIIKRIIIGVGIALVLMALKGTLLIGVHAQEMTSTNVGTYTDTITTNTAFTDYSISGNPWANWRYGHLYFSFGINKESGSATDPLLVPRNVYAASDTTNYVCHFGTASYGNSTFEGASYSVDCPMDLGWPGVTKISIAWMPISTQTTSTYKVVIGGWMTFEQNANTQVNVDTSGTTTAINNQITNDNTNTTNIINNQNQNTQQQIESQKVCNTITIDKTTPYENGYLNASGVPVIHSSISYHSTNYLSINSESIIKVTLDSNSLKRVCFYNPNKVFISCIDSFSVNDILSIPTGASFVRFTVRQSTDLPQFEVKNCQNGNQAIADGQQQINDTLNDDSGVADNDIESLFQDLDISSDTPISDLLTMPITLVQAYINGVGGTCQAVNLGSLYGTNLILPCIDLEARLGSGLWNLIDVLFSLFMIYNIAMLIINIFDKVTSLDDTFSFFTKGGDM